MRGYRSDSLSTNFFSSFTPADAYNSSRLTFTRGPNSILFGIGNPGGVLDVTTNKAALNQNFYRVDLRVDSFDGFRTAQVRWVAQLRVQNVWDDRTMLPWTAEADGTGRKIIFSRRTPGARQFVLSSTFSL